MKNYIKKIMPNSLKTILRIARDRCVLSIDMHQQASRFFRSYAKENNQQLACLETRVIFFSHQIEKGLSHKNFRYGFGQQALTNLSYSLKQLKALELDDVKHNYAYCMALSALHEYIQRHSDAEYDLALTQKLFEPTIWLEAEHFKSLQGGSYTVNSNKKSNNGTKSFAQLAIGRHAVREFAPTPVTIEEIQTAIDLARTAPSVCNRQPARVHVTYNQDIIKQALQIQGGLNGYPTPPALILVTADNQAFLFPTERNEGFVDGGLFAMQLLMSLESVGLAACPLNTMMNARNEDATRKLMQVPDNEFLIMYIIVGHFPETINLCRSTRLPTEKIMSIVE